MIEPEIDERELGQLTRQLLQTWSELEPYASEAKASRLTGLERQVVERWNSLFGPEIFYVKSARDVVAHSPDTLPPTQLKGVVQVATKLRELLLAGLQNPAAVLGQRAAASA